MPMDAAGVFTPGSGDPVNQYGVQYNQYDPWSQYTNQQGFLQVPSDPNPYTDALIHPDTPGGDTTQGFHARYFDPGFQQWSEGYTPPLPAPQWYDTWLPIITTALAGGAIGAGALGLIGPAAGAGAAAEAGGVGAAGA